MIGHFYQVSTSFIHVMIPIFPCLQTKTISEIMCSMQIEITRSRHVIKYTIYFTRVMINSAWMFPYSMRVSWNLVHRSLLSTPGYMMLCETTICEIGLRRDQQSPYVVTQFSSGETSSFQRLLRRPSCDFLKLESVRRASVASGFHRIAIPCYSSHELSIHILVFLSPSLRRFVLSSTTVWRMACISLSRSLLGNWSTW